MPLHRVRRHPGSNRVYPVFVAEEPHPVSCTKGNKKPKLKGLSPRFICKRCGWKALRKGELCKPRKKKG
jgi:hypothetical protein